MNKAAQQPRRLSLEAVSEGAVHARRIERLSATLRMPAFAMHAPRYIIDPLVNELKKRESERTVFHQLAMSYSRDVYQANAVGGAT